jgi:hypothetical protein
MFASVASSRLQLNMSSRDRAPWGGVTRVNPERWSRRSPVRLERAAGGDAAPPAIKKQISSASRVFHARCFRHPSIDLRQGSSVQCHQHHLNWLTS